MITLACSTHTSFFVIKCVRIIYKVNADVQWQTNRNYEQYNLECVLEYRCVVTTVNIIIIVIIVSINVFLSFS